MKTADIKSTSRIWFGSREIWIIITLILLVGLNVAGYFLIQARHSPSESILRLQNVHDALRSGMIHLLWVDILIISTGILALSRGCKDNCLQIPALIDGMRQPKPLSSIGGMRLGSREVWIALSALLLISLNITAYNLFMQHHLFGAPISLLGMKVNMHKCAIPILLIEAGLFSAAIAWLGRGCSAFCVHVRQHKQDSGDQPAK